MSRSPIVKWADAQPPQVAFFDDGRWFRLAEARKWAESSDAPTEELYRLPETEPIWVLVDTLLLQLNAACARQVSAPEAAGFLLQNGHELPEELQATAESLRFAPARSGSAQVAPPPRPLHPSPVANEASPSPDFRSVRWFGTPYNFSPAQAACVRVLWMAWENGTPEVGQQTILEEAGAESTRLSDVFKGNEAWKTLIVAGSTRGAFRLALPKR